MNILTFDLNLLRVLDALLREQSTVRAGDRLRLSQPAVSAALKRLRDTLGDQLFVRQGQRLVPTGFARSLEVPLRRHLDDLFELLALPREFDALNSTQNFKLAGSDYFAEMLMPPLASLLTRIAPKIQVQLVNLIPDDVMATLENHEIDLALIRKGVLPGWVDSTLAFRSRFVVIARQGHPGLAEAGLKAGDTMSMDLYCNLGHAVFSPEGKLSTMGDAALARMGRERRVAMTMPAFGGICNTVANSDLVALLPESLARNMAPRLGLEIFAAPFPIEPAQIHMAWHKRNTGQPAHRWLREVLEQVLSPLNQYLGSE